MELFHIKRHSVRKPAGHIEIRGEFTDEEGETLQCCHCGGHWVVKPGSGIRRGYCMKCNQVTCGEQDCIECIPYEKRLELAEAEGKILDDILGRRYSR